MQTPDTDQIVEWAKDVLRIEAQAIQGAIDRSVNEAFVTAFRLLYDCSGKLIVTGMGKSGLIGRKLVSTFTSLGMPSVFLHPAEAAHGDLGVMSRDDVLLAISQSGNTQELAVVLEYAHRLGVKVIGFTGNKSSLLGKLCHVWIDTAVTKEACPLGLAPTASSTLTLALGDALAVTLSRSRGFTDLDFKALHPGGGLGKRLLQVADVMRGQEELPALSPDSDMKTILLTMSRGDVRGCCIVVNEQHELQGIITDGDLRRHFDSIHPQHTKARDLMSVSPKTISPSELAAKAMKLMEDHRISVLLVVDPRKNPKRALGLVHIQDLLRALG
ncbi:MAG: KpsF/GutQ family sugar-phosphate isomerase [Bdellovibrionaceae bacterium]|nr:KpsF/GutQ family sugar-phosphate isomerase [Pseudobdellovibrionaceae bacterium]